MEPAALFTAESIEIIVALLEEAATVEDLAQRLGRSSSTVTAGKTIAATRGRSPQSPPH